ncbi:vesicle-trafficking protein SEC22a [Procambarus clarkii]|uniref:vesicle-trafficking protein SEC22a n=1 Tax=Procambarus clarkii TaxID=6728 RepID=UPI001E6753EA|nr:vesicle-trafficking protein SEC22a-like [Procambarus clarkii]XP_045582108.1 vesicle-trafficking protein SEC22a-like [Procambarus clarkii]
MIVYACLARLADGTPLSATTDFASDADQRVREGKRCVKLLSKQLAKFGKRVCLQAEEITIQCVVDDCTAYMVVCEPNYPHILAFSFLDELMKEFNILYTASVVKSVRRPYAFIEFDTFLQKTRQKYSSTRALASRLNLAEMTTDLNLHPPSYVKMQQLEPPPPPPPPLLAAPNLPASSTSHTSKAVSISNGVIANGFINKDVSMVGVALKLKPVPWYGWMGIVLSTLCIFVDIYRGAVAISMSSLEELDGPSPWHGIFFLTEMILQMTQVYMLRKYNKFRKLWTLGCAVFVLILNGSLLDVREGWICLIYITVSFSLMLATFRRPFERKLPRFHV